MAVQFEPAKPPPMSVEHLVGVHLVLLRLHVAEQVGPAETLVVRLQQLGDAEAAFERPLSDLGVDVLVVQDDELVVR
ncbi:hypothetical protein ACIBI3_00310 [Actinomadura luteofluorescens]|uniref:hypothetical protein n=1 Tax=Actinomadura luteofluorescens TaxID=46163 RepID=UPI00346D09A9